MNVLDCVKLVQNPTLYAGFLLWMLSELFEVLPEAGDLDKPKLVFFFDEAHMLFSDAPKALVQKIEQVVKLIRSKGVGVYFVTQSPSDIPDSVLAQLSNRVQHAVRAYTPAGQKAVKAAAQTFRENPAFKAAGVIMELGVGEALVSVLDGEGVPGIVQRTAIVCPQSLMGPASQPVRQAALAGDGMGKYDKSVPNSVSLTPPQAAGLAHFVAPPLPTQTLRVCAGSPFFPVLKIDSRMVVPKEKFVGRVSQHAQGGAE